MRTLSGPFVIGQVRSLPMPVLRSQQPQSRALTKDRRRYKDEWEDAGPPTKEASGSSSFRTEYRGSVRLTRREEISSRQRGRGSGRAPSRCEVGTGFGTYLLTAILACIFDGRIGMIRGSFTTSLTQRSSPSLK